VIAEDHAFWSRSIQLMIGDWLKEETSLDALLTFSETVFIAKNFNAYTADPAFINSACTHQTFSKLRNSIARTYARRAEHTTEQTAKTRLEKEAEFAYRQAFALCPYSRETVWSYTLFLNAHRRRIEATLLLKTVLRMPQLEQPDKTYYQDLATWLETQN